MKPTKRQKDLLMFIEKFIEDQGVSPTRAEMSDGLNISISSISMHLAQLKKKGYIDSIDGKIRNIFLIKTIDKKI